MDGFSNPILLKTTSEHKTISDEPKRLMTRFPTKQGQHFSLNLGQNEGPFKQSGLNGQPIMLDKFNTSTFATEMVSQTGNQVVVRQYSPRVAILGSQTFA